MQVATDIERMLAAALSGSEDLGRPPRLAAAMRHAVFPAGARVRPRLCLAVAGACEADNEALALAAAVALELLHCASLVHDDLPCFDDAALRRGQPSVHRAFGERLALLAGDALIVQAFETLALGACQCPRRLPGLVEAIATGVGARSGIMAGQAWESESCVDVRTYHQAKTGSLFVACTTAGALAAGAPPEPWRALGECIGEAYQVADDIRDVVGDAAWLGKPVGRDDALNRPSLARERGLPAALRHFERLVERAQLAVPRCAHATSLRKLVDAEAQRLIPREVAGACMTSAA